MGKFSKKRKKELLENKYILTFSKDHIIYTEEFRDCKKTRRRLKSTCGHIIRDLIPSPGSYMYP